MELILQKSLS